MKILVLQDHTDFINRMIAASLDHNIALPLSVPVLDHLRRKLCVCRVRGELRTLSEVQEMATRASPGAETDMLLRAAAAASEGSLDAWYCIADDEGVEWLTNNHAGPVLRWNGAVWWGKLTGIQIEAEIVTHEAFKARKRNRSSSRPPAEAGEAVRPGGTGGAGVRRTRVQPID